MSSDVKQKKDFWGFPVTHFSYFFTWAIVFGYLTLWLEQQAHFNGVRGLKSQVGQSGMYQLPVALCNGVRGLKYTTAAA